eukprot:1890445-Pleurochrysis_carterae.AAC.3
MRGWFTDPRVPHCGSAARRASLTARVSSPCACRTPPLKKSLAPARAGSAIVRAVASVRGATA